MVYSLYNEDCFKWMERREPNSIHAIVTDPPYGLVEYSDRELKKLRQRYGGIWRIPPKIGGTERSPLPRFTVLTTTQIETIREFFNEWGSLANKILVPGGHIFIASNPFLVTEVIEGLKKAGFEHRDIIVRLVRTLKGGNKPKLYEKTYPDVNVQPRSCWEPWVLLRKPPEGKNGENLAKWNTGGLRRDPNETPFLNVILSETAPKKERVIAPHPTLKPQRFMRRITWASLPLGKGIILDPFCGSGSTIAAAENLGLESIGIESDQQYYEMARLAIPLLSQLDVDIWSLKLNKITASSALNSLGEK